MRASVRQLKDGLSGYLRRVRRGEEIVVTSHNRPIAKIVPASELEQTTTMTREEFLADLERVRTAVQGSVTGIPGSRLVCQMRDEERA